MPACKFDETATNHNDRRRLLQKVSKGSKIDWEKQTACVEAPSLGLGYLATC